ncbi:hypothetical protein [uncultured Helicobacter sp.]|uniref:hypothetical protein n=1 Tax=uncultured Helicobacter sp. TaxID=175537 RepID=UPI002598E218|nr:hypothetical protein [uncultured Helicobacter sp.]
MSEKELEIFALCERLTELLGDKEAIADLKLLQKLHPEMFQNMQEVSTLIQEVVSEPEIIIKNPSPISEKDYIAGKKLNDKKMGEVGVRQDENIIKVFHANEKNVKKMKQLERKEVVYKQPMVGTPTSYTQAQSLDERLVDNNISSTANDIIPQSATSLENASKPIEVSESTIAKMQQKIEAFAQKGFMPNTKAKEQYIDKGKDR